MQEHRRRPRYGEATLPLTPPPRRRLHLLPDFLADRSLLIPGALFAAALVAGFATRHRPDAAGLPVLLLCAGGLVMLVPGLRRDRVLLRAATFALVCVLGVQAASSQPWGRGVDRADERTGQFVQAQAAGVGDGAGDVLGRTLARVRAWAAEHVRLPSAPTPSTTTSTTRPPTAGQASAQ